MTELFQTKRKSLSAFIKNELPEIALRPMVDPLVYSQAEDFIRSNALEEVQATTDDKISAYIREEGQYRVVIRFKNGLVKVQSQCSCREKACQHVIALLLWLQKKPVKAAAATMEEDAFKTYLENFSHEQLLRLMLQHASEEFRKKAVAEVATTAGGSLQRRQVEAIGDDISELLDDENLLTKPTKLITQLKKELKKLKPFQASQEVEVGRILLMMVKTVDGAFAQGYFHGYYGHNDYFDAPELEEFIEQFVKQLKGREKHDFVDELLPYIFSARYNTFQYLQEMAGGFFSDQEIPGLKAYFMERFEKGTAHSLLDYYSFLEDEWSEQEAEQVLRRHAQQRPEEMIEVIEELQRKYPQKAYDLVEQFLQELPKNKDLAINAYKWYIVLAKRLDRDAATVAQQALQQFPDFPMLRIIQHELPEEKSYFMALFTKLNPREALEYFEKQQLMDEAWLHLKTHLEALQSSVSYFLYRHKKKYPDKAKDILLALIELHLRESKPANYERIISALKELKEVNASEFRTQFHRIKEEYSRRNTLITLMNQKFGKVS